MARVVGIDHLVIRVKDFERSKAFYDTVLGFLGFKRKYNFDKTAGWSNGASWPTGSATTQPSSTRSATAGSSRSETRFVPRE